MAESDTAHVSSFLDDVIGKVKDGVADGDAPGDDADDTNGEPQHTGADKSGGSDGSTAFGKSGNV